MSSTRKYVIYFIISVILSFTFLSFYMMYFENLENFLKQLYSQHSMNLKKNLQSPLTIHVNRGRLGNQMFTYATLFGLSTLNNRSIQIMKKNFEILSKYFDIETSLVNETIFVEKNPWMIVNGLRDRDLHIPVTSNIIKGISYPTSFTFFHHCRQRIRDIFRFKSAYRKHAQDVLWNVKQQRPYTEVYIGVHVRRGDYLQNYYGGWLNYRQGREVDLEYFEKAIAYFTSKYNNVTFLAVSDDRDWCRNNLNNLGVLTAPNSPSAGHDLALLVECNHTILTYGTYGFWGGYLGSGEVLYFADFLKPNTTYVKNYFIKENMYPPEWIGISTTNPEFWKSYSNSNTELN